MVAEGSRRGRHSYPALDGIRAVAVLAVLLYHFGVGAMRGGFLGVDVFFVLSGYLITGQLVTRWVLGDRVSFGAFWTARARRLLPGLVVMLAGTTAAIVVLDRAQLPLFRGDLTAAATYTSNWWYVFHQRSYFEAAGRPPVLQHLWSLAVEEQFYLLWPLVIAAVLLLTRSTGNRLRLLMVVTLSLAAGSALVMGVGSALSGAPRYADPSRWYFGTDSHVTGLMLGAALALVRRGDGLGCREPRRQPAAGSFSGVLGFGAAALLVVVLARTDEFGPWLYRWGFVAVAILTVAVIAGATRPGPLAAVLSRPVLRALGRRSYAIYLWHWPVACFTRPGIDLPISWAGAFALRLGLTLLLAEVTYQWVELPVRRQGWRPAWRAVAASRVGTFRAPTVMAAVLTALAAGVVLPASAAPQGRHFDGDGTVYVSQPGRPRSVHIQVPADPDPGGPDTPAHRPQPHVTKPSGPRQPPRHDQVPTQRGLHAFALAVYGDSVPLGAIPSLAARFHSVRNDAAEGEQSWTLLPALTADARASRLDGSVVLIHTGDNGIIDSGELATALSALAGAARVVLAVPYVPRSWQEANQATVHAAARGHRNVVLMDWAATAHAHPEYLWSDAIHLTPSGERHYAALVAAAAVRR